MVVVVELEVEEETGNKAGSTVRLVGLCREHLDAGFCGVCCLDASRLGHS